MAAAGLDMDSVPSRITPVTLLIAVAGMRALLIGGVNAIVLHQQEIIQLLNRIDADSDLNRAVSTIVCRDAESIGFDTDGLGFIRTLQENLGLHPAG